MKKLLLLTSLLLCHLCLYSQSIKINEFMSSNSSVIKDEDGDYSDWIELYNAGGTSVNLQGYGLTDDPTLPFKWVFPSKVMASHSFLLVFTSDKDRTSGPYLHTNFSIKSSGETLQLVDDAGAVLDNLPPIDLDNNYSYGRKPDGSNTLVYFTTPTPAAANTTTGYTEILAKPTFSKNGGFYTTAFDLDISSTVSGGSIHYTLDGSEPTLSSPTYGGSLTMASKNGTPNKISLIRTTIPNDFWQAPAGEVFKANTVRARVFKTGALPSPIMTNTYFVDPNMVGRYTFPVISVTTDAANFFDPAKGIYVPGNGYDGVSFRTANYYQEGDAWERPVHIEMYEPNGTQVLSQDGGARIHGNYSTRWTVKSLRLYADSPFGDKSSFKYKVFPDKNLTEYKRLILRNSGSDYDGVYFMDGMIHTLVKHLDLETMAYRPSIVFVNGEYWGIQNIREREDTEYFKAYYGIDPDSIDVLETDTYINEGDDVNYNAMIAFMKNNDISQPDKYAQLKTMMDIDNFITYWVMEIIVHNNDWPYNNRKYWRKRTSSYQPNAPKGQDGRWRWMLYDTDVSFFGATDNSLERATGTQYNNANYIARRLLVNTEFKNAFINQIADQLNSTFKTERVIQVINQLKAALDPEMSEHIDRWRIPSPLSTWNNNVNDLRLFAQQRPDPMRAHTVTKFGLSGTADVTLNVQGSGQGKVQINSLLIDPNTPGVNASPYPWIGKYFKGVPVQLTAVASPGYKFKNWSGASQATTPTITVTLGGDATYTAVFEQNGGSTPIPSPFDLAQGNYSFTQWDAASPANTYPANMIFRQAGVVDPGLTEVMTANYTAAYNLASGTRINGLGTDGFSFINTSTGGNLGAAVLGLKTLGRTNVTVNWTAATVVRNKQNYAVRLQYQVGAIDETKWKDVPTAIEYVVNTASTVTPPPQDFTTNLSQATGNAVDNKALVYLRWKYYQIDATITGARPQIRVDEIAVSSSSSASSPPTVNAGNDRYITLPSGPITLTGAASDDDGQIVTYAWTKSAGPAVTIGATDGPSLTLDDLQAGTYVFKLTVTDDDHLTASSSVTVTVSATNQLPTISITNPANNSTYGVGTSLTLTADAADVGGSISKVRFFDNDAFLGESTTAPYSFFIDALTLGTHVFNAVAIDNAFGSTFSSDVTVNVVVCSAIGITPASLANLTVGVAYSQTFAANGGNGTYSFIVSSGSLPAGLTLNSNGLLSGTPTAASTSNFTVKATDSGNCTGTQSYSVTVNPGSVGQQLVSFTLINADTDLDLQTLTNGATLNLATLPTKNLNIRANTSPAKVGSVVFNLSGQQTRNFTEGVAPYALFGDATGNYNVWVPAVGSYSLKGTPFTAGGGTGTAGTALTISFTVINQTGGNRAPVVSNAIPNQNATVGTAYSFAFAANTFTDPDGNPLTYSASLSGGAALPAWLSFNASTRTFSGTVPSGTASPLNISVTASDGVAQTSTTFSLTLVTGANRAPVVSNLIPNQTATVNVPYSFTFAANTFTDPDGNPMTYSAVLSSSGAALPAWLHFTGSTRTFSGTAPSGSTSPLSIRVTASDGSSSANTSFTLTVNPAATGQQLVSFTLINADTDLDLQTLTNGATLNLATLPTKNLNIRANTNPAKVGSVVFNLSGKQIRNFTEGAAPYALFGDVTGNYNVWVPAVGSYTLKGTPFTAGGGTGTAGTALTISFSVINQVGARLANSEASDASTVLGAYPNPMNDGRFKVSLSQAYQGEISYVLVYATGVKLVGSSLNLAEPSSELSFDFSEQMRSTGVYYLRLEGKHLKGFLKLQKQ